MSISFRCPKCARSFQVADKLAGKSGKCKCGQIFKIPLRKAAATNSDDNAFSDWLGSELDKAQQEEVAKQERAQEELAKKNAAAEKARYASLQKKESVSKSSESGSAGVWVTILIFILIYGVGNLILYHFTGRVLIPGRRRR